MKKMLTSGLLILFFACSVNAAKYDNVPYDEVLKIATEQNDPVALNELGYRYLNGVEGVEKDTVKAREWFDKAIAQGSGTAESNVGTMYDKGDGVEQDYAKARYWYEKAAEQGIPEAQFNLAVMYENGVADLKKDHDKAMDLFEKACEGGVEHPICQ